MAKLSTLRIELTRSEATSLTVSYNGRMRLDLDYQIKKFTANQERRLLSETMTKELFHYIRQNAKLRPYIPTLSNSAGSSFTSDKGRADASEEYFASVFAVDSTSDEYYRAAFVRFRNASPKFPLIPTKLSGFCRVSQLPPSKFTTVFLRFYKKDAPLRFVILYLIS
ncbi:unnamed protein product [Haemonchus placei]|uniref:RGS domain-containing protein n=1 Tax=Haemonchus placei TaxID=6290 RepID=A0A0N4VS60_HAEPC|nr:unnamed protein product [Haemonchus placei]